jgi:hypothetical protein
MKQGHRYGLIILTTLLVVIGAYAGWTRLRSPESAARHESYPVYIALLKGFNGDVSYVGSDDSYAYFRIGRVFWSYYKVLACVVHLPKTFRVHDDDPYVVKLRVYQGSVVHHPDECQGKEDFTFGELEET